MLNEIKEALAKATPGPWKFGNSGEGERLILGSNDKYIASVQIHQIPRMYGIHDEVEREANARLIANFPEWINILIGEVEKERKRADYWQNEQLEVRKANLELLKKISVLEDALSVERSRT